MIPGLDIANASGWTVAVALGVTVLLMIIRGTLVPRRFYKDMMTERDFHRSASEAKDDTISELTGQVRRYAEVNTRANSAFLQALSPAPHDHETQDEH